MARDIREQGADREHRADRGAAGDFMGDLIAFRSQRPSGEARPSGAGAEILFFTGVRYQRMSEDAPSSIATPHQPRQGGKAAARSSQAATPRLSRPLRPKIRLAIPRPFRYWPRRDTSPQREAPI